MLLSYEPGRRLKIAVAGSGNHAYRSLFPCFNYLPVELVATCDLALARPRVYGDHFGGREAFGSFAEMLAKSDAEVVLLAAGPAQHPDLSCQALPVGRHP